MLISPAHDRAERRGLPGHLAADGVERAGRAGHRDERGVACHAGGGPVELGLGRVQAVDAARPGCSRAASTPSAHHRQHPAVPAQERAQEHAGAGHACRPPPRRLVVAVVAQEQLLQRRRLAGQRRGPRRRAARRSTASSRAVSTSKRTRVALDRRGRARRAAPSRPSGDRGQLGGDRRAGQVPQLGERAGLDAAAGADDAHPVAQRLHLGQDVARQQHRAPVARGTSSTQSWNTASISGSSPEVGSSRTSSSTSEASAATSATFCRLPLE